MPARFFGLVAVLVSFAALGQPSIAPQTVEIPSGALHLKAYLWVPPGPGRFPAVLFNHGRSDSAQCHWREGNLTLVAAAQAIGPVFVRHGYVFLFPFRRGEGPSANQGDFIGDLLEREESTAGIEAKKHLQLILLRTDQLEDGLASLAFLKRVPKVDHRRIALIGHSFGGQLTLLEAARDHTVRVAVTFGAAAASWSGSEETRTSLLGAADRITVPLLLIHTANDYSVAPGQAIAAELARLSKPYALKIYPPVGKSSSEGHNFLYSNVSLWETDLFQFIGEKMRR
ncbi:MAG TPA: dienelactone hydrolase family protein [Steroidobacteraceae bacterium]|nr:dienelactone hydrolase family protein [Steroidobacteraceae bacterium]